MQHPPRPDCQAEGWHLCVPILRTIREDQYPSDEQMRAIHAVLDAFEAPTVVCVECGAAADPRLTDTAALCEACYRREHYLAKLAEMDAMVEERNYWHSQAHLLATELEAERGKRWCRCGDEASVCAVCHTLPTQSWR